MSDQRQERMSRARARVAEIRERYTDRSGIMKTYLEQYPLLIASIATEKDVPYLLKLTERLMQMIERGSKEDGA